MSALARTARLIRARPAAALASQVRIAPSFVRLYASKSFPAHTVIDMPALSPTMSQGNVGTWKKAEGDSLSPGDVLVEIETDKATMDFEFQEEGFLAKVLVAEGSKDVTVGQPIGVYVEDEADVAAFKDFTIEDAGGNKGGAAQEAPKEEAKEEAKDASKEGTAKDEGKDEAKSSTATTSSGSSSGAPSGRIFASPRAKMIALDKGIKLADIKGSGPNGRIIARDVENYKPAAAAAAPAAASAAAAAPAAAAYKDIPISGMRKTIASRLTESKRLNPDYIVSSTVSVSKLLQVRQALNESANGEFKLSINDLLIKAVAIANKKVPQVNSAWIESEQVIREYTNVDVSIAVATATGLITPVLRNANLLGLAEISKQAKDLGKRARDNKLKPEEYQGGTISISNMGMNHAVSMFSAIINPPQAAIVAIGTVEKRAVEDIEAENGIAFDDVITITGTFDHKVVDGAVGGEWLKALKEVIENPLHLML